MSEPCPLCAATDISPYHSDKTRDYVRCGTCDLVFVPRAQHLSHEAEKAEYDLHNNQVDDPGYRKFLSRMFEPMCERISAGSIGLEFGCGPGPALASMFSEAGHDMSVFDLYYAPNAAVFEQAYDFITATEVVEHLAKPRRELDLLWTVLKPGGWLGLMTKRVSTLEAFKDWHYITDPTHICFFSDATFAWLAERWGANLVVIGKDVVLIEKGEPSPINNT